MSYNTVRVSIVTTCFNERENIERLIPMIRNAMRGLFHEIIVVDDSSPDETFNSALKLADLAIRKKREGQTKGLKLGIEAAKYPVILTMDSDLENNPKDIPRLLEALEKHDIVVAGRERLPRITEKLFSLCYARRIGVRDMLSNFRAFRKDVAHSISFGDFESYGAEFLIKAKARGYKIAEITIETIRRRKPRLGNRLTANLKIFIAFLRCLFLNTSNEPQIHLSVKRPCSYE